MKQEKKMEGGVQAPNYTGIPNVFLDNMDLYTGAEVKVFCAICRKVLGWHKTKDRISQSQIYDMTGCSKDTIQRVMKVLVRDEWIKQEMTDQGYVYELNMYELPTINRIQGIRKLGDLWDNLKNS